jgi:hypothetical protein
MEVVDCNLNTGVTALMVVEEEEEEEAEKEKEKDDGKEVQ